MSVQLSLMVIHVVPYWILVASTSSVSHSFYKKYLKGCPIQRITNLMKVVGAGGKEVPFLGYIEVMVGFPSKEVSINGNYPALILVVPDNPYNERVPIIIGTNVAKQCREQCVKTYGRNYLQLAKCSSAWAQAYKCLTCARVLSLSKRGVTLM